ncbi:MAG: thiamine pyrophosphate-binding protein, partial [Betaproteobacteria bacterium]|nr:thiamine pyrophosphate-binding protein [Betaproteobacteria bacterium]
WCDRMPMLVVGATGPVAAEKRRPWIDWIHTAKDQGALLREYTKWDDEPRSAEAIVGSFLRASQLARTSPRAPVYICLDAGLQEERLAKPVAIPDAARFAPPEEPRASAEVVERVAAMLIAAKKPLLLMGRTSRKREDWDRRVRLAELLGATVLTSIRERSSFPTEHPLHPVSPFYAVPPQAKEIISGAEVILSLDWVDLNGMLQQVKRATAELAPRIVHVSLDAILHNGWSMDYFGIPPADVPVMASADVFVSQLLPALEKKLGGKPRGSAPAKPAAALAYSDKAATQIAPRDIEVALAKARGSRKFTIANVPRNWKGDAYRLRDPLDFLGNNAGGGLGAGPGLTVGAALALKGSGRPVVSVMGDGDFLQGATALWTAARYRLPALFIVSNNRSYFNDEVHQQTVAQARGRPAENRWIGQKLDDPAPDLGGIARAQGVEGEGPVKTVPELEHAIERGLAAVQSGKPYLIDALVPAGERSPHLPRGEG